MKKIKIKGGAKSLTPAAPMLTALVCTAVLLPLRIWQLSSNTELSTGFFVERNVFVYVFFVLAVAASFATAVLSYLCGKMPSEKQAQVKRPLSGIASLLLGVAFGYEALKTFGELQYAAAASGLSLYDACVINGTFRDLIEAVLGAIAMLSFVLYFVAFVNGKYAWLRFTAVLFLAAPIWGVLRVISYFTYTISYLVVAELFCEMYATIFLMIFLFCFARAVTETGAEGGAWTVVASGLLSAMFCLFASVPRIFTSVIGLGTVEGFGIDWIFAAGAVFSVVTVLSFVTKGIAEKNAEEELPAVAGEDGDIPVQPFTVE